MGKLIYKNKLFKIIILVLVVGLIVTIITSRYNYNSPRYKIYFLDRQMPLFNYTFGILPKDYNELYKETVLEDSDLYSLHNVIDMTSPIYLNYIIFKEKASNKESIIKGYPISIFRPYKDNEELEWPNYFSEQINLKIFNLYIEKNEISSKKDIKYKFCYLLSKPEKPNSFKIVKNNKELNDLIVSLEIKEIEKDYIVSNEYNLIDQDSNLKFESNHIYCWFKTIGLIKFSFEFEDDLPKLSSVSSEHIGFLGNEE